MLSFGREPRQASCFLEPDIQMKTCLFIKIDLHLKKKIDDFKCYSALWVDFCILLKYFTFISVILLVWELVGAAPVNRSIRN